jgi:hypothetical protein
MTTPNGIVDPAINVFWLQEWENQGYGLEQGRQDQLQKILGMTVDEIRKKLSANDGSYVAFIAIRWGFARLFHNILVKTEKWEHRGKYDIFGKPK